MGLESFALVGLTILLIVSEGSPLIFGEKLALNILRNIGSRMTQLATNDLLLNCSSILYSYIETRLTRLLACNSTV